MIDSYSILIIEDEKNILDFMARTLRSNGYKTITSETGQSGLSIINSQCPDLILLDLGLPDMDGNDIISSVRKWTSCPIIVISARAGEQDKVAALDLGADDYITKPFRYVRTTGTYPYVLCVTVTVWLPILLVFIRPYKCQGLMLDFEKRMVTLDGKEIHLTPVEYKIVAYLSKNSGKVMTYASVMENVWGPFTDSNNRILRVNMANIRRKIERNPSQPQFLFTEVGVGYRMCEDENEM